MTHRLVFDEKDRIGEWVAAQVDQTAHWGSFYAMGVEDHTGEILAGTVFNNWNGSNAYQHIAVARFTKKLPSMLWHGFIYAFEHCNLNRLTAVIDADNEKSLRLARHTGYVDEFVMQKAGADGQDKIFLVMWPENCSQWLGKKL